MRQLFQARRLCVKSIRKCSNFPLRVSKKAASGEAAFKDLVSLPEPSTGGCRGWGGSSSGPAITCGSVLSSQGQCPNSASTRAGGAGPFRYPNGIKGPLLKPGVAYFDCNIAVRRRDPG